jgi:gliding motility-associated lipoprotein GldH
MTTSIRFMLLIGAVCGLLSCDNNTFFEEKREIPGGVWMYRDSVDFRFTVSDTTELYHMYVDFEHADTFPHQNIYLKLYTRFPDGKRLSRSRSFDLFDAQGASSGACSGGTCRVHSLLQNNAYFNRPGEYVITLEQFMRRDSLPGIRSVGLMIDKAGKKR